MQNLAAYSFEAKTDNPDSRISVLDELIDDWLKNKGANNSRAADGSFVSKTGDGTGQFSRQTIVSAVGTLREVELIETAHTKAMFTTHLQIANVDDRIVVHATLSATPGESRVAPIGVYPRCPHIIRSIIERFPDWRFAGQEIPLAIPFDATDPQRAKVLCDILRSETRRLPIVVVSVDEDELVWPDLHRKAAESLIGLADVAFVSAQSSWVLTDELGPRDSCYLGAVRLYWPGRRQDGTLSGINWRAHRLASLGNDDSGRNRFLAILRREIMSVAALTMPAPPLYREIRRSAEKERILALEKGARDRELDSIIEENERLSTQLEKVKRENSTLQWKIAHANYIQRDESAANDDEGEAPVEALEHKPPEPGEIRFYKKIGSGGGIDTLVQTKQCNHKESNWRPAFKGDQAEKGLIKLEGRNNWKSLAHCSACTGGGRWRVHW